MQWKVGDDPMAQPALRLRKMKAKSGGASFGAAEFWAVRSELSIFLSDFRQAKGWTLKEMAKQVGVSAATLSKLETGVQKTLWSPGRRKLAHYFGFDLFELDEMAETVVADVSVSVEEALWADDSLGEHGKARVLAVLQEVRAGTGG
jgi:transcriptional regulator with XRE-family HTH domain